MRGVLSKFRRTEKPKYGARTERWSFGLVSTLIPRVATAARSSGGRSARGDRCRRSLPAPRPPRPKRHVAVRVEHYHEGDQSLRSAQHHARTPAEDHLSEPREGDAPAGDRHEAAYPRSFPSPGLPQAWSGKDGKSHGCDGAGTVSTPGTGAPGSVEAKRAKEAAAMRADTPAVSEQRRTIGAWDCSPPFVSRCRVAPRRLGRRGPPGGGGALLFGFRARAALSAKQSRYGGGWPKSEQGG